MAEVAGLNEIRKKYRMTADYHTHTVYSKVGPYYHGKGEVADNVSAAAMLGLKEIAITDHGPSDIYGLRMRHFDRIRADVDAAALLHPEMSVLLGIEADLKNTSNGLDITCEEAARFDIVNAGYHISVPGCRAPQSIISTRIGAPAGSLEKLRAFNTGLALRALYSNNIRVLTHPGDKGPFDMRELCRACEETGTWMEISSRHTHMTVSELKISFDYDVRYVISSDAHKPSQVGMYETGLKRALEAGVPLDRIVNIVEVE